METLKKVAAVTAMLSLWVTIPIGAMLGYNALAASGLLTVNQLDGLVAIVAAAGMAVGVGTTAWGINICLD